MESSYLLQLTIICTAICALLWATSVSGGETGTGVQYRWDENGYVLYCPCMGRFGNQAAHFLGSLAFAKALNRTLAVPPWRSYLHNQNVPFSDFFQMESVQIYHHSLPLDHFMEYLAPVHWPPGNRTGYCYAPSTLNKDREDEDCDMKYGNPFGPFWDEFSVDFDRSEFTRMTYQISYPSVLNRWLQKYPSSTHPVLAFKGAPASFPVLPEHRSLQQYVQWNERMEKQALEYISNTFGEHTPFIAVHLRMGSDWERACKSAVGRERFMESVQCLEDMPGALITEDLCIPSVNSVSQHLIALTRRTKIYTVFVASDVEGETHGLQQQLGSKIKTYYLSPNFPQLDLIIMGKANQFVGNCISSFSAFVKRERDVKGKPSDFFGLSEIKENYTQGKKSEL